MKRKFLSIISFVLALTMILPMSIFVSADLPEGAAIEAKSSTIYTGGENTKTTLKIVGVTLTKTNWSTLDTDIVSVDSATGEVTAKSKGTAKITANFRYMDGAGAAAQEVDGSLSTTITVEEYKIVAARIGSGTVYNYVDGQSIPKSDIKVEVQYNDSDKWIPTDGFDYTPKTASKNNSKIEVTVTGYSGKLEYDINVAEYNPADYVKDFAITSPTTATEFYVGDKIKTSDVEVKITDINDNITYAKLSDNLNLKASGITFTNGAYTFSAADVTTKPTLTVEYVGTGKTDSVTLNVKEKQSTGTGLTFTLTVANAPTKKAYVVGETFDRTGMSVSVKDSNGKTYGGTECEVTYAEYVFKDSDAGKTSITLNAGVKLTSAPGITYNTTLTVTGLTINAASTKLDIYRLSSFTLNQSKYPVGYKISMDDVDTITYYSSNSSSSKKTLSGLDLTKHADEFTIEVLDKDGDEKSRKSTTIEEDDIREEKDSSGKTVECVYIRLTADNATASTKSYRYYTKTVLVGDSGVYYYFDDEDELVKIYESIDDALKYAQEQDDDVDEDDFDLEDVTSRHHVLLKLGEDQKTSATKKIELNHNVVIDMNGHDLTFYEDRLGFDDKDCTLTITNTSSDEAKLTYANLGITLTLSKGDELEFEYGEEIPGVYTVTVSVGANGTVTATPKISGSNEIKVGHGSDIKFTITPKTDYVLDTIKVDSKAVDEKDYTTSSTGVVTYTLKAVGKSCKVDITFKNDDTLKTWKNPFTDVSASDSYYSAVKFVYENELFNGTSLNKFSPDTTMTRAMFVTVLGRLAGADVSRFKTSSYSDVPINSTTSWYAPYVEWATQMGLVEGYGDGTFGPNNKITRQQMYVLMYRYTIYVENKKTTLTSASINASDAEDVADWAYDAVKYASQNNFLVKIGTSSRIDPKGEAKRSELAQLLEKYCVTVLKWEIK